ncbi:MAG: DUF6411 family protein [Solirubrobacteraceae bacterium]
MLIGAVIVVCILLLILGFLLPRLSRGPERGANKVFGSGGRIAGKAPGKLGTWLSKPFSKSSRAASKSASAGRKGRNKID